MDSILNDIFGDNQPGIGKVTVEKSRQDRKEDIELAKYLKGKYGGHYIVLSDISPQGVKVPDLLLTDKAIFESKNVSSLSSVDSQTKKALTQLDEENLSKYRNGLGSKGLCKVLALNVEEDLDADAKTIKTTVRHRIKRYSAHRAPCIDYVMVKRSGRVTFWPVKKSP